MTPTLVWTENRLTNTWTAGDYTISWTWTNATQLRRNGELLKVVRPGSVKVLMEHADGLEN